MICGQPHFNTRGEYCPPGPPPRSTEQVGHGEVVTRGARSPGAGTAVRVAVGLAFQGWGSGPARSDGDAGDGWCGWDDTPPQAAVREPPSTAEANGMHRDPGQWGSAHRSRELPHSGTPRHGPRTGHTKGSPD